MNTIALVVALYESFSFLHSLEHKIREKDSTHTYWKTVSLKHNTITLSLHVKNDTVSRNMSPTYIEVFFNVENENIILDHLYCDNTAIKEELHTYIAAHAPKRFDTALLKTPSVFTEEVLAYLQSADEIAKQAYQCAPGDNYYPGYFSEISIEEDQIMLKQVNRWNARSLNHKKDYHMRDLELYIPLTSDAIQKAFAEEQIGRMRIHFSDHSTPNNKACGDKIAEQIKIERQKYVSEGK
ncbi:MAG TPA: hypothetical protein VK796_13675 [Cytophaga sp.]|jgi:hypothetical protein|nr:hypothetical protein [Cytophaga sp.]